jgi:1-acyl-sn-glycerol-3-phosphate acyltransferase
VIPKTNSALLRIFSSYSRWYVGRHFHSVSLSRSGSVPSTTEIPIIVYLNHASWWDPLVGLLLAQKFWPARRHYAPIDAAALSRYRILSRLGFFGVEANTPRGAATFLKSSVEILKSSSSVIWITSEGRFRDPRTRPVELRPGLAHLARRISPAIVVPLAIEYPFWEERFPEVLCRFGTPIESSSQSRTTARWTAHFAQTMRNNQDALAAESMARGPEMFQTILRGRVGVGAVYDAWRWGIAKLKGERFHRDHGEPEP